MRFLNCPVIVLTAILWSHGHAVAAGYPCSYGDINPAYPALNAPPAVQAYDAGTNAAAPSGANCFSDHDRAAIWITVASVIQTPLSPDDFIKRFGAVSQLRGVQYWSTTDQAWRPMAATAFAVNTADTDQPRADYSPAELLGISRYYRVTDTRTYLPIEYRLEVRPSPHGHVLVETSNVDPIKKWGITLYKTDGIHTFYFLNERSPGIWSYYSITRVVPATFLAKGHEESYINRAVALYRHYMQLPTSAAPPAAR